MAPADDLLHGPATRNFDRVIATRPDIVNIDDLFTFRRRMEVGGSRHDMGADDRKSSPTSFDVAPQGPVSPVRR